MKQVENFTKIETFKQLKKGKTDQIHNIFAELKFNKKVPKYNYHSGLVAGMLVDNLTILKPLFEEKSIDNNLAETILKRLIPMAQSLCTDYNWKFYDLNNLVHQFFGDDK